MFYIVLQGPRPIERTLSQGTKNTEVAPQYRDIAELLIRSARVSAPAAPVQRSLHSRCILGCNDDATMMHSDKPRQEPRRN